MYHFVIGGYHGSGFWALMISLQIVYIAILKHLLTSVHYNDANMNICIFME